MKLKHGIIFLAGGYILDFIGGWMKITHQLYANETIFVAAIFKSIGVVVIAIRILRNPRFKDL